MSNRSSDGSSDQSQSDRSRSLRRAAILGRIVFAWMVLHLLAIYWGPAWLQESLTLPGSDRYYAYKRMQQDGDRNTPSVMRSKVSTRNGRTYLWGGPMPDQAFDITERTFEPAQLHYGLGRESFPALVNPKMVSISEVAHGSGESPSAEEHRPSQAIDPARSLANLRDDSKVIVVKVNDDVRIYPVVLLTEHEVVNDVVGGRPVFVAYCILADLGAVYDRQYGDHTFTFAVSGYTYYDESVWDGYDAFILWDRDTESLWWPPVGEAVSGPLIGTELQVTDHQYWAQMTWGEAIAEYPEAKVLASGQTYDGPPPESFPQHEPKDPATASAQPPATQPSDESIAPRWGENAAL